MQPQSPWDPLDAVKEHDANILAAATKREMQNILRSYVGFFDPFSELLQNALDAVDARERVVGRFEKRIAIRIDIRGGTFSVTDNGIGFTERQFRTFLCPNVSFKDADVSRGKKGVGSTYIGYGFNFLQMATKSPEFTYTAELSNGRAWLDDRQSIIDRPQVRSSVLIHEALENFDRGSSFTIRFGGANTRPRDLSWIQASTATQWRTLLLLKTPLGQIELPGDEQYESVLFDLEVIDQNGAKTELLNQSIGYIFPHLVIGSSVNVADIVREQERIRDRQQDVSRLPDRFRRLNAVYGYWNANDLSEFPLSSSVVDLVRAHSIGAYGFFGFSVKLWDQFNDTIAQLRRGLRVLRGGLQLATDRMPQGDQLVIPLSSNIGYQNQSHVVVRFHRADPDLGRKGFQPELREAAEEIAGTIVNRLKKWRHLLKADSGASPSIVGESQLDEWIKRQELHETVRPLAISNPNFFVPINEISISAEPVSEQDVVVLFNQLVAGGVIRGMRLLATSSHQQYDGIYRFFISEPFANHLFEPNSNPLGVQELRHDKPFTSKPYVLEYKHNVDALIQEFESEEKSEQHIDLVVAWDIGDEWRKRYSVTSLLDLQNLQHREFHGLTHVFRDERTGDVRFYGVILSELIAYLNDVRGVQDLHRSKYGDA